MARKKHKQKQLQAKRTKQADTHPGQRLSEAQAALAAGSPLVTIELATKALKADLDPAVRTYARQLLVEGHFRAGAAAAGPDERLAHLEAARQESPQQARLHHHLGLTLLRLGRPADAAAAFDSAVALAPDRLGLKFQRALAKLIAGKTWTDAGLNAAEVNSLALAAALTAAKEQRDLASRFRGKLLVGQADGLWQLLLQMLDQPKFSPGARYASERAAANQLAENPIAVYYAGVAALRQGDTETPLLTWRNLAAAKTLTTPWFAANRARLTRAEATALAEAENWEAVVALRPSPAEVTADSVLAEILAAAHFRLGEVAAAAESWTQAAHHWQQANLLAPDRRTAQNLALAQEKLGAWQDAAASWREMVRRRPRKADHPDALTDDQVAAIWRHTADCYAQVKNREEETVCLRNAIKYREQDPELRVRLADVHLAEQRIDAACNELERVLAFAPDHIQALGRLAFLYGEFGFGNPLPLWRRLVALDPTSQDARDALAEHYVELAAAEVEEDRLGRLTKRAGARQLKVLQEGLAELPGHPLLLLELGQAQVRLGDDRAAQSTLRQAWETDPRNPAHVGLAMHELLHTKADAIVAELLPSIHDIPGLLSTFWINQADQAVHCELDARWIDRFCQEALTLAARRQSQDSPIVALMSICDLLYDESVPDTLRDPWLLRARTEGAHAGLGEFIDAKQATLAGKTSKALDLLRKGRRLAEKANEPAAVQFFQNVENFLQRPQSPFAGLLDQFSPEELLEMLGGMGRGRNRR